MFTVSDDGVAPTTTARSAKLDLTLSHAPATLDLTHARSHQSHPEAEIKLRSDPESLERDFGEHDVVAARVVPVEQVRVVRDYLDEALVVRENREWLFGSFVPVEGVVEEEVVDIVEGVDWDTVLRDECEVKVQRVVEEGLGDEPTRGGDE